MIFLNDIDFVQRMDLEIQNKEHSCTKHNTLFCNSPNMTTSFVDLNLQLRNEKFLYAAKPFPQNENSRCVKIQTIFLRNRSRNRKRC